MSKKIKFLLVLCTAYQMALGQLFSIPEAVDFIEVDGLENIYTVKGSELKLYNNDGNLIARYSNKINGAISCLDVTNPLRILLFYKEGNTVVFLNQQLSQISDPVDVYQSINIEVASVGISSGSSFWAFSINTQTLILINSKLEILLESANLRDWIGENSIEFVREQNQYVYLGLANKVLVFDTFGSYITTLHFNDAECIKMAENRISIANNKNLVTYNIALKNEMEVAIPANSENAKVFSAGTRIYCQFNDSIAVYNLE